VRLQPCELNTFHQFELQYQHSPGSSYSAHRCLLKSGHLDASFNMARCKQTNRTRARWTPKSRSPNAAVDRTAPTITHDTTDDSPTDLADQFNTLSFSSRQSLPRRPTASTHKSSAGRIRKPRAPKFLPKYRVGKYTKRVEAGSVGVKKGGNSTGGKDRTTLLYCLDCVRPHLHVYCDGVKELKTTHLCSYHTRK
jgi:hypothetical protein